jgi:hypothetical protein
MLWVYNLEASSFSGWIGFEVLRIESPSSFPVLVSNSVNGMRHDLLNIPWSFIWHYELDAME